MASGLFPVSRMAVPDKLIPTHRDARSFCGELGLLENQPGILSFSNPRRFVFSTEGERETSFVALINESNPKQLIWKAKLTVIASEVEHIFNLVRGHGHSVHINTGTHGNQQGFTIWDIKNEGANKIKLFAESKFLMEDLKLACDDENTSLITVSTYVPPIYPLKANHIIDAWCFSFNRLSVSRLDSKENQVGLILRGKCSLGHCTIREKVQDVFIGMGNFDFGRDLFEKSVCVKCDSVLDVQELLLFDCSYKVIKRVRGKKEIINESKKCDFQLKRILIGECEQLKIEASI